MNYCPNCGHLLPNEEPKVSYGPTRADGCEAILTAKEIQGLAYRPQRLETLVNSELGRELVDIVNVLRGLGTPENEVKRVVESRLT